MTDASATAAQTNRSSPVFLGRHRPNFSVPFSLGDGDRSILSMRGLDAGEQDAAAAIWTSARGAVASGNGLAFLKGLDGAQLSVLQEAASLADPIRPDGLSEEGAENLLLAPTEGVDLDRNGLVEVGAARTFVFPPVDASPELRSAWQDATAGLGEGDVLMLQARFAMSSFAADGSGPVVPDYSAPDFDWKSLVARLLEGNEASRPYNTDAQYRAEDRRLHRFLDALQRHGLA